MRLLQSSAMVWNLTLMMVMGLVCAQMIKSIQNAIVSLLARWQRFKALMMMRALLCKTCNFRTTRSNRRGVKLLRFVILLLVEQMGLQFTAASQILFLLRRLIADIIDLSVMFKADERRLLIIMITVECDTSVSRARMELRQSLRARQNLLLLCRMLLT